MFYEGAIYRPPSEAHSLILQITVGCRHNACTFCSVFKEKRFRIKSGDEISAIIAQARYQYPNAKRIFLADGDALTVDTPLLSEILTKLYNSFPALERVGIYGGPKDILAKDPAELSALRRQGLNIVYLGVESGSALVLQAVHKGVSPGEMIEAGRRVKESGLTLSCTVILGLGGKRHTGKHALQTAAVINAIDPDFLAPLTLIIEPLAPISRAVHRGEFELLSPLESLVELQQMIEPLTLADCVFRSNHASNYLPLRAHLPAEKEALLQTIKEIITYHRLDRLRPEGLRAL